MNARLMRGVVLPAWQYVTGQDSLKLLRQLERTQWLSPDELQALQWQRIGAVLQHAADHVPYYADVLKRVGVDVPSIVASRSLEMLPLLDRATIRDCASTLRSAGMPAERFVPNGTGGSTGEPLRFFDDRHGLGWSTAAVWRAQRWLGIDVGERAAYLWGADFDISSFQGLRGRIKSSTLNMLMLRAWQLTTQTAEQYWTRLVSFRPRLLVAYAGALHQFSRLLGPGRDPIPGLRAIVVSAETLFDDARATIESCFNVPVYNRYGGRDLKFVAQECAMRQGLHMNGETVFVELIRDGRTVETGELGEVVITRLDNFAMPFVRYRTGDLAVMSSSHCPCGRSLPMLQRVEGRLQDGLTAADGRIVSGLFVAHMMKDCPDVREFQVRQTAIDRLVVAVVLVNPPEFPSRSRIERIIRAQVGQQVRIDFDLRQEIPLTRNGKRRIVVSELTGGATAVPHRAGPPRLAGTEFCEKTVASP
jgi:phenylacetate-CoA ligase